MQFGNNLPTIAVFMTNTIGFAIDFRITKLEQFGAKVTAA
jgi:hypothetical protein